MTNKTLIDTLEYCKANSPDNILLQNPDGTIQILPVNSVSYFEHQGEVHLCISNLTNEQILKLMIPLDLRASTPSSDNQ